MKVLFISTEDSKYGAPRAMLAMMRTLQVNHGVEPVLLTMKENEMQDFCEAHGIEHYSCCYGDMMSGSVFEGRGKNALKHTVKYLQYVRSRLLRFQADRLEIPFEEIDLIHSNTNRIDIGAYFGEKYHIPHIWHLREMDEGTKGMVYYKRNWADYMNRHAAAFFAITEVVRNSWIRHGLDEDKIKVVYDGIDLSPIEKRIDRPDGLLKIASAGRVEKSKGQEDLARAVCCLPPEMQSRIVIDFIGEPYAEYERKLRAILKKGVCRAQVNFLGYCRDVPHRLKDYDVGITCSPAEAFGLTTVEYMAAGLLTIATDTGSNLELMEDGVSGLLYRQGDHRHLAEVLQGVYEKKYDEDTIREAGMRRAAEAFTAEENARNVYEEYLRIAGGQSAEYSANRA
ncbi:MAG: glycosyltransferase family 4 protein [Lachnospiraceae bacterium]|nr:glycosyltransferase family 4 protein [Lachnospiraceae bacterium]